MSDNNDPLIDFVTEVSGEEFLKVEEDFGDGYVRLKVTEAERRQAKHDIQSVEDVVIELLRNSRDAHSKRVFIASWRDGDMRNLVVIDDGIGIPAQMHEKVFEPRVTSKLETMGTDRWGVHGRGMALFSIKENVTSARVTASEEHKGTVIHVCADVNTLPERADQSSWPILEADDDGRTIVTRGPHNIVRRAVEFACDHPEVDVYLGTPAEIVATMCELTGKVLTPAKAAFLDDPSTVPIWQRCSTCPDAAGLAATASALGLDISERTAHRILAKETSVLATVMETLTSTGDREDDREPDIYADRRSVRIHHSDMDDFKRELLDAFDTLADRYYLSPKGEPSVTIGKDEIRVRFKFEKED